MDTIDYIYNKFWGELSQFRPKSDALIHIDTETSPHRHYFCFWDISVPTISLQEFETHVKGLIDQSLKTHNHVTIITWRAEECVFILNHATPMIDPIEYEDAIDKYIDQNCPQLTIAWG